MSLIILSQFPVSDQFGNTVNWELFSDVPQVIIMAGEKAAVDAKEWGSFRQTKFNQGYQPSTEHLQKLHPHENIKIIAVATLPEVPRIFKGLFRAGFRKEAKEMGLALDFSSGLRKEFGYERKQSEACLALLEPKSGAGFQVKKIVCGSSKKESLRDEVQRDVAALIKTLERGS